MTNYYVLKKNGQVRRVAKIVDNAIAYGYDGANWVEMSNLMKIQNEITDYEPITENEAKKIISETY